MVEGWIADRMAGIDSSGIRKVFDLAAKMSNPVNLSIGQPDFDVPESVREAAIEAIQSRKNGYALTQGMPQLREKLQARVDKIGHEDRSVFVTSGTSGALQLSLMALVNPGDEVIFFDPYFVMYPALVRLAGGVPVIIDTYPDFKIPIEKVEAAITPKTKAILFNSPANPTGVVNSKEEIKALAELAQKHNLALISDEIYSTFCYEDNFASPADYYPQTIVIDGFSKSYGMTGWRVGWMHGPKALMEAMIRLQQYSFVCAPHPFQLAAVTALDIDQSKEVDNYRKKRDMILDGLKDHYEIPHPGGAFYIFPKLPWGPGEKFIKTAIDNNLLIIPGSIFSNKDTNFRISYAASDETIQKGIDILVKLAKEGK
ncbi:N-acetyl-LL-diaminopimelate aminotransferase [Planctomycetales bacterium 10988]|nr:N-acetyl-LL-diaminopimelate aminotransferase [Planctomycetales bacterium 10988]